MRELHSLVVRSSGRTVTQEERVPIYTPQHLPEMRHSKEVLQGGVRGRGFQRYSSARNRRCSGARRPARRADETTAGLINDFVAGTL